MNILISMAMVTLAIIFVIAARKLVMDYVPKVIFVAIWVVLCVRMLIPFAIPVHIPLLNGMADVGTWWQQAETHTYDYGEAVTRGAVLSSGESVTNSIVPPVGEIAGRVLSPYRESFLPPTGNIFINDDIQPSSYTSTAAPANILPAYVSGHEQSPRAVNPRLVIFTIWLAGTLALALYFIVNHYNFRRAMRDSLPAEDKYIPTNILLLHNEATRTKRTRNIQVRHSHKVNSPVTYGLLNPVIVMPTATYRQDRIKLNYIYAHEHVHIRRFDCIWKAIFAAALCIHWFNPFVWLMFFLANRDIELSCDEAVLKHIGIEAKPAYAHMLLDMAERQCKLAMYSSFSKYAIEERIIKMINMKKKSVVLTALLVVLMAVMAACTAMHPVAGETGAISLGTPQNEQEIFMLDSLDTTGTSNSEARAFKDYRVYGENFTVFYIRDLRLQEDLSNVAMYMYEAAQIGVNALERLFGISLSGTSVASFYTPARESIVNIGPSITYENVQARGESNTMQELIVISPEQRSQFGHICSLLTQFFIYDSLTKSSNWFECCNSNLQGKDCWFEYLRNTYTSEEIFHRGLRIYTPVPPFWTGIITHDGKSYFYAIYTETGEIRELRRCTTPQFNSFDTSGNAIEVTSSINFAVTPEGKQQGVDEPLYAMQIVEQMGIFEGNVSRARVARYMPGDIDTALSHFTVARDGVHSPVPFLTRMVYVCVESDIGEYAQVVITVFYEGAMQVRELTTDRNRRNLAYNSWRLEYNGIWTPCHLFEWVDR